MAISRARKEELLAEYRRQLSESNGFVMAEYTGLSVPQMQNLRHGAREQDSEVFVIKNTLFAMALEEAGIEVPEELLTGPTVVAFAREDVPSVARLLRDFTQSVDEDRFIVKGALMEGKIFGRDEVAAIANLPTRDELFSQVLRAINAPATQMAGVVASGIRQVVNVIKAYADKLEEAEGGGSTEAAEAAA